MKKTMAALIAVAFLASSGVAFASPTSDKAKSGLQNIKCTLKYNFDKLKCKKDQACKDDCKQQLDTCKAGGK